MEKIGNIMPAKKFVEPAEIVLIKAFVLSKYSTVVQVSVHPHQITIVTASAALAGSLRLDLKELSSIVQTKKKLIIRIGDGF